MRICAGDLRHRIEVQRPSTTDDDHGGQRRRLWTTVATLSAKADMGGADEVEAHGRIETRQTWTFTTRFIGGTARPAAQDRIVWNGMAYGVRSVENVQGRNQWLVIVATLGEPTP